MTFKQGDLVMVVRPAPCCGFHHSLGRVFTVKKNATGQGECKHCGAITPAGHVTILDSGGPIQTNRLRLISPLYEPEAIDTGEPIEVMT